MARLYPEKDASLSRVTPVEAAFSRSFCLYCGFQLPFWCGCSIFYSMSVTHDPNHERIVVESSEEGSQDSEPLLVDGEEDGIDVDDVATASDVYQPLPPPPYEGNTCNHPRRPNDIHHTKCKPCRQRNGILLCDYDACCASCFKLPNDVFDQMINDWKENARKLQLKRDRFANKTQQPEATRPSSRLASAGTSTSNTPAEPPRRLSSKEVRTLLQTPSPKVSPAKPAPSLLPNSSFSDLKLQKMSLKRFCNRKGFHPETAARTELIQGFFTVPLATISSSLVDLNKPSPQVTPT